MRKPPDMPADARIGRGIGAGMSRTGSSGRQAWRGAPEPGGRSAAAVRRAGCGRRRLRAAVAGAGRPARASRSICCCWRTMIWLSCSSMSSAKLALISSSVRRRSMSCVVSMAGIRTDSRRRADPLRSPRAKARRGAAQSGRRAAVAMFMVLAARTAGRGGRRQPGMFAGGIGQVLLPTQVAHVARRQSGIVARQQGSHVLAAGQARSRTDGRGAASQAAAPP